MPRSTNKFAAQQSHDYEFKHANGGGKIGKLRVKQSSLLWKPKGAHHYHSVPLSAFAEWAEKNGTKATK